MPRRPLILTALSACAVLTSACASWFPRPAPLPLLTLPESARTVCRLPILPPAPTLADLEAIYTARGAALIECNAARQMAVDSFDAQQQAVKAAAKD